MSQLKETKTVNVLVEQQKVFPVNKLTTECVKQSDNLWQSKN